MAKLCDSVTEAIGNTPLVALDRITADLDGRIFAKMDMLNPGFSKKDRAARQIIEDSEADGSLKPGQTVVELTSGNMGTGLAIVCGNKGYPFIAVMSRGNSPERARMMRALGAEVVLVDQHPESLPGEVSGADLELVENETRKIAHDRDAFQVDQFARQGNLRAHYLTTGPEIWQQSGENIHAFCDFAGSGGTYAGVTRYLKEQNSDIGCYIVEPEGAAALAGKPVTNPAHPIQGGGYSQKELVFIEQVPVDGYLEVTGRQAREGAALLAKKEGVFAGFSSGANLMAALQLLDGPHKGGNIAIVICDSGLKYLSTDLWDAQ
jgi:cysteine synthase A